MDITTILRRKIVDTETPYVFSNSVLDDYILEAVRKYNSEKTLTVLKDVEKDIVIMLAWIEILYVLAGNHAKYYRLSIAGMDIDKSGPFGNYLQMIQYLKGELKELLMSASDSDIEGGMIPGISIGELTYRDVTTNLRVPYALSKAPDDFILEQTFLNTPIPRNIRLLWDMYTHPEFLRYDVYRSTNIDSDGTMLVTLPDNHINYWEDVNVPTGKYYYRVYVIDVSLLKGKSNQLVVEVS